MATKTTDNMVPLPDASVEALAATTEKPIDARAGESPAEFASEVMQNAENAKTDVETSFNFYTQKPEYQTAPFMDVHQHAQSELNTAWAGLQNGIQEVLERKPDVVTEPDKKSVDMKSNSELVLESAAAPDDMTKMEIPLKPAEEKPKRRTRAKPVYEPIEETFPEATQPVVDIPMRQEVPVHVPRAVVKDLPEVHEGEIVDESPEAKTDNNSQDEVIDVEVSEKPQEAEPEVYDLKPEAPQSEPETYAVKPPVETPKRPRGRPRKVVQAPAEEIPVAKVATPEEIARYAGKYSPEVIIPKSREQVEQEKLEQWTERTNNLTDAVRERVNSVQRQAEVLRQRQAERAQTVEQRNYQEAQRAAERAAERMAARGESKTIYEKFRTMPMLKPFKGLIDRLEASSAAKKAEKLSVKLSKVEAKLAQQNSPEKVASLKQKHDKLSGEKIAYEERRNKAVDRTVLKINEKIAPRKEQAEQIKTKLESLGRRIVQYKDYRNEMAKKFNKLTEQEKKDNEVRKQDIEGKVVRTRDANLRKRSLKALRKEFDKTDVLIDKYSREYNALNARKLKLDGMLSRWDDHSKGFLDLKGKTESVQEVPNRKSPREAFRPSNN